jgi:hypothetical protein
MLKYQKVLTGGMILKTQTEEINLDGKSINMRLIEEILDNKTEDEIVSMIAQEDKIDWTVLAALQVYAHTSGLFPVKDSKEWRSVLAVEQKRLDTAYEFLSRVSFKLTGKKILTSGISEEWKSKKPGHEMYSIKYLTSGGTETQYFISEGEYHRFISLEDALKFLELYKKIYDIITAGKSIEPSATSIVIIVEKVAKRTEIKR